MIFYQYVPAGVTEKWTVQGHPREARVVSPLVAKGAPVVICFHGGGGQAYFAVDEYAIHKNWPEALVYYAQGLPGRGGFTTWSRADLPFFDELRRDAIHRRGADPSRLFVMGYSTGANFAGDLWGLRGSLIAGLAFVSGGRFESSWPHRPVYLSYGESEPEASRLRVLGKRLSARGEATVNPRHEGHTYPQNQNQSLADFLKACPPLKPSNEAK